MSRIIAGISGGTRLSSVPGSGTRPTSDRVKEALFSRLESYGVLAGAKVLDLFAGSGALGVECASRGAAAAELVESNAKAAAVCQQNADLVNRVIGHSAVRVHQVKAESYLERDAVEGWDLVFLDPPYSFTDTKLAHLLGKLVPSLLDGAVVVLERSARSPEPQWPEGLTRFAEKKYGDTRLWFAEPSAAPDPEAT